MTKPPCNDINRKEDHPEHSQGDIRKLEICVVGKEPDLGYCPDDDAEANDPTDLPGPGYRVQAFLYGVVMQFCIVGMALLWMFLEEEYCKQRQDDEWHRSHEWRLDPPNRQRRNEEGGERCQA